MALAIIWKKTDTKLISSFLKIKNNTKSISWFQSLNGRSDGWNTRKHFRKWDILAVATDFYVETWQTHNWHNITPFYPLLFHSIPSLLCPHNNTKKNGTCEPRLCEMCSHTHFPRVPKFGTLARPKANQGSPSEEEASEMVHRGGSRGVRWPSHHHQTPQILGRQWRRPFGLWWLYVEQGVYGSLPKVDWGTQCSTPSCKGLNLHSLCYLTHPVWFFLGLIFGHQCVRSVTIGLCPTI